MKDTFYLAWKYILHYKTKSFILTACLVIILFLPICLEIVMNESEKQLLSRAFNTPLILGSKGSIIDLTMNSLYFDDDIPELIQNSQVNNIKNTNLADLIPLYIRFRARNFPIIGTSVDYFNLRELQLVQGRNFAVIGECVIGSNVAEQLKLEVGNHIVSSPENIFDLAGIYPLKMKIVGVLKKTHSFDDFGVFTDVKTTWIIQGLGHGHQDVSRINDPTLAYKNTDSVTVATAKLNQYNEITEENLSSFHFHGNLDNYPLTSILIFPKDIKSETLLRGRYISSESSVQLIKPLEVVADLLQNIFRIRNLLDSIIGLVAISTFLACILVFYLSMKLRANELTTMYKLGCQKITIFKLFTSEILLFSILSFLFCSLISLIFYFNKTGIVIKLIEQF